MPVFLLPNTENPSPTPSHSCSSPFLPPVQKPLPSPPGLLHLIILLLHLIHLLLIILLLLTLLPPPTILLLFIMPLHLIMLSLRIIYFLSSSLSQPLVTHSMKSPRTGSQTGEQLSRNFSTCLLPLRDIYHLIRIENKSKQKCSQRIYNCIVLHCVVLYNYLIK